MNTEAEFKIGDFVYHNEPSDIGLITDVYQTPAGKWGYRIDYCQGKGLCGPRGGNGPVWRDGFPKPITGVSDILYVEALKLSKRIKDLKGETTAVEEDLAAVIRSRDLLTKKHDLQTL